MRLPRLRHRHLPARGRVRVAGPVVAPQAEHRRGAEPDHARRARGRSVADRLDGARLRGTVPMSRAVLSISGLHATVEGKEILKGVDLQVAQGEIHALMGPNGSGKSTLAYTLMGHPKYTVTGGSVTFDGSDLLPLTADARARLGLFLCFQYPTAIPGVSTVNFLRAALRAQGKEMPAREFLNRLSTEMRELQIDESFRARYINDGFSGGEKKRAE